MARLELSPGTVTVRLTGAERLWSLRGDVEVPRSAVVRASVAEDGLAAVHGVRAPGLALPGRVKIGTWRGRGGKDLVAVRRGQAAVVVELGEGAPWRRLVVGADDRAAAERTAQDLSA